MADAPDLRGKALFDALMAIKPASLSPTTWAIEAGLNRGFLTNLKSSSGSVRSDNLNKLLAYIGRSHADLIGGVPAPDQPPTKLADAGDTVEISQLDLSFSMGPGTTIDDYIEETTLRFDLAYVRSFTRTETDCLRLAKGVGESMQPTLRSSDMVWIDTTQRTLNQQDRIWAFSIHGAAAIKRLRKIDATRVEIISDNPDVDNQIVDLADIVLGGRVLRFARDL